MPFFFRRLFARLPLVQRLRQRWGSTRGFPLARYVPGTPRLTGGTHDVFLPPNSATLGAAATSQQAAESVAAILSRLTQNDEVEHVRALYLCAQDRFGPHWRSADILTALWGAATLIGPSSYLEIGVFRGRSASVVGATHPDCAIYGFDLWIEDYFAAPNTGPDFVRQELLAAGHRGSVTLTSGPSAETLPAFLRQHPDLYFDLITVDGDHSFLGAARDLANTLPRLKVGGIVVLDDICLAPDLKRLWESVIERDTRYVTWEFTDGGPGVAAAVRISDQPLSHLGAAR
ncbi:MAG: class I SAM-dependent methyltransferase [Dehalococcoidia bacterium]